MIANKKNKNTEVYSKLLLRKFKNRIPRIIETDKTKNSQPLKGMLVMRLYGSFKMPNIALFMANNEPYMIIEANFAAAGNIKLNAKTPIPAYKAMDEIGTTKIPDNKK